MLCVLIVYTDNGGNVNAGASNFPLRGNKYLFFEGGIRSVSFVTSPLLKTAGTINKELMHISDWYPTLLKLTGVSTEGLQLDGYDIWPCIV